MCHAFYYACSYAKVDYSGFMNVTAKIALHLIPESLKSQPIFICIDDTMVSKISLKFENVSKLLTMLRITIPTISMGTAL